MRRKKAKSLPTHETAKARDIAALYWEKLFADYGLPKIIISDRDPKFTSDFWRRLFKILGTQLKPSTSHHPQTDGLAERAIQTMVDMVRRYCSFGLLYRDTQGYTHDWVSLIPALEMAYNSSKHAVTGRAPLNSKRVGFPATRTPCEFTSRSWRRRLCKND